MKARRSFFRRTTFLKQELLRFLYDNRITLFILLAFFLLGIGVGIASFFSITKIFSLTDLTDKILVSFVKGKMTGFKFFILRMGQACLACFLFFCLTRHRFLMLFLYFFVAYLGYTLAFNASVLILFYGAGGILWIILFYIPCQTVLLALQFLFACICLQQLKYKIKYGQARSKGLIGLNMYTLLLLFAAILAVVILEGIILPTMLKRLLIFA